MSLPPDRRPTAYQKRVDAATLARDRPYNGHQNNGEESGPTAYSNYIANYSKGLPHDGNTGEVDPSAYAALLTAVTSHNPPDFENIPLGIPAPTSPSAPKRRRLTNPQSGLAFDLEGPDSHHVTQVAAPRIDSPDGAAEIAELYWMSLLRDIDFIDFDGNSKIQQAANSLMNAFPNYPNWPKDNRGRITTSTIFRGNFEGDLDGPYISQFLLVGNEDKAINRDEKEGYVKYGTTSIDQRHVVAVKGLDFMTDYATWLQVQNGLETSVDPLKDGNNSHFDRRPRFIRNMRDLATYVHFDALYQAYLTACLYMLRAGEPSFDPTKSRFPFNPNNPYMTNNSMNQDGFGTFGGPHVLSLVTEAATRALKAVWLQKWFVHRRLRPEAFGGLIHRHIIEKKRTGGAGPYTMIHSSILNSTVLLDKVFDRNKDLNRRHNRGNRDGTYLLSQAFTEGSPTHPSYGAGHATVAGACVTILKAFFNEDAKIVNPVVPNDTGIRLVDYTGRGRNNLTVRGELNKLAANIAIGRNMAGVHYRSDYIESLKLGEQIAIGILEEQHVTMYNEPYRFTFTKFGETQKTSIPP